MIFRYVRNRDNDLVKSVAYNQKYFKILSHQNVDIGKYFQVYKEYYKDNGWNYVLLLNVISYPTIIFSAICESFL